MYEDVYDNYIRNMYGLNNDYSSNCRISNINDELENYYPEIYKIIYPMVKKACDSNYGSINENVIENLTNEIYYSLEGNSQLNEEFESVSETRQFGNGPLQDLIKILLLRELIGRLQGGRPPVSPSRPPYPNYGYGPFPNPRPFPPPPLRR